MAVVDAGFTIREMLESDVDRFVLREAINCTARRNELPERKEKGRPPEYGDIVRPLSRCYRESDSRPQLQTRLVNLSIVVA
ncbi:hypothetical protein KFU94_11980 [Chloroflexi bacterium TSY]|nr:hypothetical protein [Chloroflexi bacterium TSY]MBV7328959.1 hypothetical protein [Chloroflexi bacterium TSY]